MELEDFVTSPLFNRYFDLSSLQDGGMIAAHLNHCRAVMTHLVLFSRMRTRCKEHIEVWRFAIQSI